MESTNELAVPVYDEQLQVLKQQLGAMAPAHVLAVFSEEQAELSQSGIAKNALQPGVEAPLFTLPDATGNNVSLQNELKNNNVILTFYRGVWCPFCNLQLKLYQEILPQIKALGATLIAVSPMTPDNSISMKEKHSLEFSVLSDFDNATARKYGIVFTQAAHVAEVGIQLGADIAKFNGVEKREVPIPATFFIGKDGLIKHTFAEGDYTKRLEPQQILNILTGLNK